MEILSPTSPNREPEECVALGLDSVLPGWGKGGTTNEKNNPENHVKAS